MRSILEVLKPQIRLRQGHEMVKISRNRQVKSAPYTSSFSVQTMGRPQLEVMSPKVSVVIPYYNGEQFIGEAITSVLNQTYQNFEIVIVDDGSKNGAEAAIGPFLKGSRIKLVKHPVNRGIPSARNTGIKNSSGEFIAFLDQDDQGLPEKLKEQLDIFEHSPSNLGLVFGDVFLLSKDKYVLQKRWTIPRNKDINSLPRKSVLECLFMYNFIPMVTLMIKRECITNVGMLNENIKGGADDHEWCLRIAAKYNIHYINAPLAIYRIHEHNYSDPQKMFCDELAIVNEVVLREPFLAKLKNKKLSILYYRVGRFYQLNKKYLDANTYLLKAVKYRPLELKFVAALLLSYLGRFGNAVSGIMKIGNM